MINADQIVTIDEADKDFDRVTQIADQNGEAVIVKNGKPQYVLINIEENPLIDLTDNEKIDIVAKRILERYKSAFLELAKN